MTWLYNIALPAAVLILLSILLANEIYSLLFEDQKMIFFLHFNGFKNLLLEFNVDNRYFTDLFQNKL